MPGLVQTALSLVSNRKIIIFGPHTQHKTT
jgi:hypothetical protein